MHLWRVDPPVFDPAPLARLSEQAARYGDSGIVTDLVEGALESIEATTRSIALAAERRDLEGLRLEAHRLKSVLRQVGALAMGEACATIEALAAQGDARALEVVPRLSALREPTLRALDVQLHPPG